MPEERQPVPQSYEPEGAFWRAGGGTPTFWDLFLFRPQCRASRRVIPHLLALTLGQEQQQGWDWEGGG